MAYSYSIELISGLRPKNNQRFPLVRADDVIVEETPEELWLPEALRRKASKSWVEQQIAQIVGGDGITQHWPFHTATSDENALTTWLRDTAFPITYQTTTGSDPEQRTISGAQFAELVYNPEVDGLVHLVDKDDGTEVARFNRRTGEYDSVPQGISSLVFADGKDSIVVLERLTLLPYAVNVWTPDYIWGPDWGVRVSFDLGEEVGAHEPVTLYETGKAISRGMLLNYNGHLFHSRSAYTAEENTGWQAVSSSMDFMAREMLLVVNCMNLNAAPTMDWPPEVKFYTGASAPTAPRPNRVSVYRCTEVMLNGWNVVLESCTAIAESIEDYVPPVQPSQPSQSQQGGGGARLMSVSPHATSADGTVSIPPKHASLSEYATVTVDDTAGWAEDPGYVPGKGEIVVYTDAVPAADDGSSSAQEATVRIKVGTGNATVADLEFLDADLGRRVLANARAIQAHVEDTGMHLRPGEREYWNDKVTVDEAAVSRETLLVTKDNLLL